MPSLTARAVRRAMRRIMKIDASDPEVVVRQLRKSLDRTPTPTLVPRGVSKRAVDPAELPGVSGEWYGVDAPRCSVLYHHGGGYVSGGPRTHRNLGSRLAAGLRGELLLARYRLAPEHPHPAAVDDAVHSYRALAKRSDPARIAVGGDSAGGGLTLALLQRIRDEGLPPPAAGVLLSPWADLTNDAPSRAANDAADDMLSSGMLMGAGAAYAGGRDRRDPAISPLFGDLGGLPPLLVSVDESEILLDDATRIVDGVRAAGGEATLIRRTGLFHVWPALVPVLREARETVAEIVGFLDTHLPRA